MKTNRTLAVAIVALSLSLFVSFCFSIPALATSPGTNGKIVFLEGHSIFRVNPDGTGLTMVAAPPANLSYQDPAWSPDGNRIAFTSSNSAGTSSSLNVINADGTNLTPLYSSNSFFGNPTWSPDGSQIAFAVSSSVTTFDTSIWVINSDGSNLHNLIPATTSQPAWSPDGKKIAVVVGGQGNHNIWLKNADGTGSLTQLTSGTQDGSPTWSPDGTQIAFGAPGTVANYQIYRIKVDGTGRTELGNGTTYDTHPSWSPDGTRIAFQSADIWTMSAVDGSGRIQIVPSCDCASSPDWQPLTGTALPLASINDVRLLDGNFATTNATFTVSLSTASNQMVTVNFATANGTAISGRDYQANSGTLVFGRGEASKQVTVLIYGNTLPEPDKTFFVNLSNPVNAVIARAQGTGTILNANTTLSIDDVTVTRSNSGTTAALFTVSLSPPANFPVTVEFATANGSATSPLDYVAQSGKLTFSPLETSKQISIVVNGQTANLPPQTYFVNLSNPTNAILAKAAGAGTIINPDFPPVTPGPQIEVARFETGTQFQTPLEIPTMGMNAAGDFVIAWVQPGRPRPMINEGVTDIYAQRFNSQGIAQGPAFRVNDPQFPLSNIDSNWQPAVAMDADGNFVVVWTAGVADTANIGGSVAGKIFGQRYDAFGRPVGTNFIVNTSDDRSQEFQPSVAMYASGDFVVAWSSPIFSDPHDPQSHGCAQCVLAQRFDANGGRLGDKFLVSSLPNGGFDPAVAVSPVEPVGNFVIVWNGTGRAAPGYGIFGRLFASDGTALGSEFRVNTSYNSTEHPSVGMDVDGNFTATWGNGISAQRFSATGLALGGEFKVNATSFGVFRPSIGVGANGDFVVAWDGVDSNMSPTSVFARVYHGNGAPQGGDFRVNQGTLGSFYAAARMDFAGNFVVSWEADIGSNLGAAVGGIFFRQFAAPPPARPFLLIGNAMVAKRPLGATDAVFTVRLSTPSAQTITVNFSTADGTAAAGTDYTAASGTLTFAPGETSKQIIVQIYGGLPNSSDRTFFVNLSNLTNATIFRSRGRGTILAPRHIAYTISAAPPSLLVGASATKTSTIVLHSQNGISESVQLTGVWIGTTPSGASFMVSPAQVSVPSASAVVATLTLTTFASPSPGTFNLRITGTSASGVTRQLDLSVVIYARASSPTCRCTKTGPFKDPRVEGLVDTSSSATVTTFYTSGVPYLKLTRSDGAIIVPPTRDYGAHGFSPNGKFFVLITFQTQLNGSNINFLTLYSVDKGVVPAVRGISNPLHWGFSPDDDNRFFVFAASSNLPNQSDIHVYDTGTDTQALEDNAIYSAVPGWADPNNVGGNNQTVGGWGFSPDGHSFLLSYKITSPAVTNAHFLSVWNLTHTPALHTFGEQNNDFGAIWQFSPCGDLLMLFSQAAVTPTSSDRVEFRFTSNGQTYKATTLAPPGPPSASVIAKTDGSKEIQLMGMALPSIPSPPCTDLTTATPPSPTCGCAKTGPFLSPSVKGLVPIEGLEPSSRFAIVDANAGVLMVSRKIDHRTIVLLNGATVSTFGFSPNGKFLVVVTKLPLALTLYSVERAAAVGIQSGAQGITNPLHWGFSPDDDNQFFVVAASSNLPNQADIHIYDTGTGTQVLADNAIYSAIPGWADPNSVGGNDQTVGGWGFSPDGHSFLLSYKVTSIAVTNAHFMSVWNLTHTPALKTVDGSGEEFATIWQFSPCGDLLMLVSQEAVNPTFSDRVELRFTSNGQLYNHTTLAPPGLPSASAITKTDGSKEIQLMGMALPSIPDPQCTISTTAHSPVNILLIDQNGRETGFDPVTGGVVNQIPGSSYTGVGSEPQTITAPYLPGPYLIDAFGLPSLTSPQPYRLTITITDASGDIVDQRDLSAIASRGSEQHFGFMSVGDRATGINAIVMPPLIEPVISGRLGNNGWYVSDVGVSWNVTPLSEITAMSGCQPLTVTSDTPGTSFTCTATSADGTTSKSVTIKRNAVPPAITVLRTPPPNANGWNNTDVTVNFTASALSGIASVSGPVTLTSEGANQVVTGAATSVAGISASVSVTVNIDKTPPEAFTQFGPTQQDLQVFGRDALSGISADPFSPISVVRVPGDHHDGEHRGDAGDSDHHGKDDNADEDEDGELRTYRLEDLAGNAVVLVELVKKEGHEIKARVVSTQYNGGPVLVVPRNRARFEWDLNEAGSLKELEQKLEVGVGVTRQEIQAEFQASENRTIIRQQEPKPETKLVRPGLVLLRMATDKGKLAFEF